MFDPQLPLTFSEAVPLPDKVVVCVKAKARRDAIKAAGGVEYEVLLVKERAARAIYRRKNPRAWKSNRMGVPFKTYLCAKARLRGRKRGFEATITPPDVTWPSHCPVLGIELDYPKLSGMRKSHAVRPNWPSLDRWDNTKGYVPGNVFVISYRANTLKNSATYNEILKVAKYLSRRPKGRSP
jgi:hypothetical protein